MQDWDKIRTDWVTFGAPDEPEEDELPTTEQPLLAVA